MNRKGEMNARCSNCDADCSTTGELSVGVALNVTHSAATPRGASVTANARDVGREGKLFKLEVFAEDAGGEIGRGIQKRAVVSEERLLAGALKSNTR